MARIDFEFLLSEFEKWYKKIIDFYTLFFEPLRVDIYDDLTAIGFPDSVATTLQNWLNNSYIGDMSLAYLTLQIFGTIAVVYVFIWVLRSIPIL